MPRWVDQAEALVLAAMRELFRDNQLLELAGRGSHRAEALPELAMVAPGAVRANWLEPGRDNS